MEAQRRKTPADVLVYYENLLPKLKSTAISDYLKEFDKFGGQLEDQFTTQLEKKLSIIFKALGSVSDAPNMPTVTLWLQNLEDYGVNLENILGDIENFHQLTADRQKQTTTTEDQNELSSDTDRPNLKGQIEPSSDETGYRGLESTGEESEVDLDEEELPQDEPVTNNQGASILKRIYEYNKNFEENIYKQGVILGVIKEFVETSHEEQRPLIVSHDNVIQNGSEEPSASIDPESLQSLNRENNRTSSRRIQSRRRNDSDRLVVCMLWLCRVLNLIFEILQFIFIELNDKRNISDSLCHTLLLITSAICFFISIWEFCVEAKRSQAVLQKKGKCYWLYNRDNGQLFGCFSLYLSVILSAVQFFINLIVLLLKKEFIKADILGLVFAVASTIAPMCHPREPQRND